MRRIGKCLRLFCAIACLLTSGLAAAREHHGQVTFAGTPVPGATVTATLGDKKIIAVTDEQGNYSFPDLEDGTWTIDVEMQGFSPLTMQVAIAANAPPPPPWELKMLALDDMKAEVKAVVVTPSTPSPQANKAPGKPPVQPGQTKPPDKSDQAKPADNKTPETTTAPAQDETDQRANDGFLINGSTNNGAASPFAQMAAFGNSRNGAKGLYTGMVGVVFSTSALNANQFSLNGLPSPKPTYFQGTGVATLGGPLKIPHVWKSPGTFFVGYQWRRSPTDTDVDGLVPTLLEREGNFSQSVNSFGQPVQIFNPATGLPFNNNTVPVSPQAQALLNLYPMPNATGNTQYNYQVPVILDTHQDSMQSRFSKSLNRKNQFFGSFSFQSTRVSSPNLFGFVDRTSSLGLIGNANWLHRFNQHTTMTLQYQFSRLASLATPYWANRENISGEAGITGNNQLPTNWGPPTLGFSSVNALSDGISSHNRNQTSTVSESVLWNHRSHNITFGGDFRRQEFNYLSQSDPRGIFTFTGAATAQYTGGQPVKGTGFDLADFVLGIPDTSQIAFGNADKYFRESGYDAFVSDDWRVTPKFSASLGLRWEYSAPITELFNRLVNLDVASNFGVVAPVLANNPTGQVTSQTYPTSLVRPDKHGIEPRLGIAWRPFSGSSWVIHAGYGVYFDSSVYQNIAVQMAQQAPLSTSLNLSNSAGCPLTLAVGFPTCSTSSISPDSFAIDPNFRVGYAQNWNASVQRDLPGSLVVTVTYLGVKGTRGPQEFYPNTYAPGATNPCPTCTSGFIFETSNGNSTREAGQVQVRRRLHNGLTATATYVYSKSIDDDSFLGGAGATGASGGTAQGSATAAQNWLNLGAQRGLSTFDQRHLLTAQITYTTGMGLGGKTLMSGWKGRLYKEWTILNTISVGSGLPQTPIFFEQLPGTTNASIIRPDVVPGASVYAVPTGLFLNPAAYTAPVSGQFGDAGRDSITGPAQFTWNLSMARTFRMSDRLNLDIQLASTNILNHVTFTSWNTTVNSELFGAPATANPMRSILTTVRLRF